MKSLVEKLSLDALTRLGTESPVMGIPEKPCFDFAARTSPTQFSGLRTNGSRIKPCSNFFTFLTSLAWNSVEQLWWIIPIPPFSWKTDMIFFKYMLTFWTIMWIIKIEISTLIKDEVYFNHNLEHKMHHN